MTDSELNDIVEQHALWLESRGYQGARADFNGVDISGKILSGFNLRGADFANAICVSTILRETDLFGADLSYADFTNANFANADIRGIKATGIITTGATGLPETICPQTGSFTGYKVCGSNRQYIVTLTIPSSAQRSSGAGRICRCSEAIVADVRNKSGNQYSGQVKNSMYKGKTLYYKLGETVHPDSFDTCRWHESSHGIHFFMTESEALLYRS